MRGGGEDLAKLVKLLDADRYEMRIDEQEPPTSATCLPLNHTDPPQFEAAELSETVSALPQTSVPVTG